MREAGAFFTTRHRWWVRAALYWPFCSTLAPSFRRARQPLNTRIALVVGNNASVRIPALANAVNDALAMAEALRSTGFEVITAIDASTNELQVAKQRFIKGISGGGIGVFHFSGHGLQVEGRNYLLPVDFSSGSVAALSQSELSVPAFLDEVEAAKPKLLIAILDACRDNPFQSEAPPSAAKRGLSEAARSIPTGTLVLYAASSNQSALEPLPNAPKNHGLFTGEFLAAMQVPGLELRDLSHRVRYTVMEKARAFGHLQVPALYDNLSPGVFYFRPRGQPMSDGASRSNPLPPQVKIIIPFAAGGPSDVLIRAVLPLLAKELGRELVAENVVDVQGDRVRLSLRLTARKMAAHCSISPFATAARRFRANDNRLVPIEIFADTPLSIATNVSLNARSLSELRRAARASRRRLWMAAPLRGSPAEQCGQQVLNKFGSDVVELVSVNGEALAMQEVQTGKADFTCGSTAAVRNIAGQQGSRITELAEVRSSASPLATPARIQAAGRQGFDLIAPNWLALFAPAGTSTDLTREISAALARLQSNASFVEVIGRMNALPVSSSQATPEGLMDGFDWRLLFKVETPPRNWTGRWTGVGTRLSAGAAMSFYTLLMADARQRLLPQAA